MMERQRVSKELIFRNDLKHISNIYDFEKIGAGHDGIVFRYGDKALKLLKYDIKYRKEKQLMTFEKAVYFQEKLNVKRIEKPIDTLLDLDGVYTGYVMDFLDDVTLEKKKELSTYKSPGDFTCWDFLNFAFELEEDFDELTKNNILAKDINQGSYIYTSDFIHLCDMDKYRILPNNSLGTHLNKSTLNFVLAKFLYYEILNSNDVSKAQLKQLSNWVRKSSNSRTFLRDLSVEIGSDYNYPIGKFAKDKGKMLIR